MDISNAMLDLISESLKHPGPGHGIIMRPARATAADYDACSAVTPGHRLCVLRSPDGFGR